ncbi:acyltransferase family protein [Microbulbifer sp. SA54]|uniref:acyltransferase family protein n=1 Tax=Microbulbifer sp. SA54 TaxID=3401577 RepID=UPI003AAE5CE3
MTRIDRLDALRGIAALLVVWQHTSESFVKIPGVAERGSWLADVAWSVDFGRIGVVCFFLISGFIIPHSFSSGQGALKQFAVRRFFRLFPIYWLSVLLAILIGGVFASRSWEPATIVANLTMLQKIFGYAHIQGLYWTLQVELIFYSICAGLFFAGKLRNMVFLTILSVGLVALFAVQEIFIRLQGWGLGVSAELRYIPYFLAIMFCGTILRAVIWDDNSLRMKIFFLMAPAAAFSIPVGVLFLHWVGISVIDAPIRFGAPYPIALAVFLLAVFLPWQVPKLLSWLGLISYSVYLFHPVVMTLVHWLHKQSWAAFTGHWSLWVFMGWAFLVTILIASATYYLVERPAIQLGRRFSRGREVEPLAVA